MLRNPNFDLGQLINDDDKIDNLFLFDGKEIYLQLADAETHLPYISALGKDKLQILVREWHPDTWELSDVKMIDFPK